MHYTILNHKEPVDCPLGWLLDTTTSVPPLTPESAVCTNAVVAICVVLVHAAAVGALGVPVRVGEANGAFAFNVVCKLSTFAIV